jgi:hypothetical protein
MISSQRNNATEQIIHPSVLWHEGDFGTQIRQDAQFVEAIMAAVAMPD